MNNKIIIIIFYFSLLSSLFSQWALWNNPTLPVGSSDKGVGLWAGQVMGSLDGAYEFINWNHSPVGNENYDHYGTLASYILNPALTIGLSDYINLTISSTLGNRIMNYQEVAGVNPTPHHRDEGTHTDFLNQANGESLEIHVYYYVI